MEFSCINLLRYLHSISSTTVLTSFVIQLYIEKLLKFTISEFHSMRNAYMNSKLKLFKFIRILLLHLQNKYKTKVLVFTYIAFQKYFNYK